MLRGGEDDRNAGLKAVVGGVGTKIGRKAGGIGDVRENWVGRGGGKGSIRELRQEDKVANKYHYETEPSEHIAPVLGWNSTTQL